jgi:hypothetical protein
MKKHNPEVMRVGRGQGVNVLPKFNPLPISTLEKQNPFQVDFQSTRLDAQAPLPKPRKIVIASISVSSARRNFNWLAESRTYPTTTSSRSSITLAFAQAITFFLLNQR